MLTAELVRATVRGGEVRPSWVGEGDARTRELAERLVQLFEAHVGRRRRELDEALENLTGAGVDFRLHRGLARLCLERSQFATAGGLEPLEVRRAVFEAAAGARAAGPAGPAGPAGRFDRDAVMRRAAERLGSDPASLESALYGDLESEQVLASFKPVDAAGLLARYDEALAQAVLLKATRLEVRISGQSPERYRELFRSVKFFRLMHSVEGTREAGYRIRLDGPLSVLGASQRYGLRMAQFLPTLLALGGWRLEAEVRWGRDRQPRAFRLEASSAPRTRRALRGQWRPQELGWLPERFEKLGSEWEISEEPELVDLGGRGVLIPDFVFTHRPSGTRVWFEVLGFWRRGAVPSRLALLREHGPPNVLLGLGRDLRVEEEATADLPGEVYIFRSHPVAREVLERLGRFLSEGEEGRRARS